ncbi:MAG: TrkA family potassium uptake protein [Chloroflexi bacterium]|nr:TrkA family potassium uptake protein [Chloroflexota bacterium]MBI5053418.1 TrkA family potassium uptake protein [Chloroflexota bacterium]MBI5079684.1 TrkA family potassium uptake protein [Chloroflexota bacterium]MBI5715112.1 TrkA family potassium uptake protein [Chloroflexota bacterium]
MLVIVVGGGRTGSHLATLLHSQGHQVRLIEHRKPTLTRLHRELPTEIIVEGEGTDPQILESAEIKEAQVVAAVTDNDADNLVTASLARFHFNVKRVIARVNNPKNAWLFTQEMGVDVSLNHADLMAKLIEEEMSLGDMMILSKLRRGKYTLVEEKIYPGAKAIGVAIKDLLLPPNCVISGILRGSEMIMPRGITTLEAGDEIIAMVDDDAAHELARLLGRPNEY